MWSKLLEFQHMWFGHSCYQGNVYHLYQYMLKASVLLLALWFYHLISQKCLFKKHKQISTIAQPIFLKKIRPELPVNTFEDVTNHLALHICALKSKRPCFYKSKHFFSSWPATRSFSRYSPLHSSSSIALIFGLEAGRGRERISGEHPSCLRTGRSSRSTPHCTS